MKKGTGNQVRPW